MEGEGGLVVGNEWGQGGSWGSRLECRKLLIRGRMYEGGREKNALAT